MTDKRYWLWLQMALGEGARFTEIIDDFGSVENLYNSNIIEWRMSPALTSKQINSLQKYSLEDTEQIIYNCKNNGWQIITFDDDQYPCRLKEIPNPPAVLYVDGVLPNIDDTVAIGIVGTRKASDYAVKVANLMSRAISTCNALVISGGALGVDTAAHNGALSTGGKTVAVLGCGLGTSYLNENKQLRTKIKQNGALVTEYPPFTKASKFTFPLRNRIVSGLSLGVLVVEAGVKSGSLITANYANEQGRDVYTIPSSILDVNFAGSNKLIDDGATVATKPEHLVERYCERFATLDISKMPTLQQLLKQGKDNGANLPHQEEQFAFDKIAQSRKERLQKEEKSLLLKGDEKLVYDALDDKFVHIDTITENTDLPAHQVLTALTMLEMKGIVQSTSGKRYKLS